MLQIKESANPKINKKSLLMKKKPRDKVDE